MLLVNSKGPQLLNMVLVITTHIPALARFLAAMADPVIEHNEWRRSIALNLVLVGAAMLGDGAITRTSARRLRYLCWQSRY